MKAWKVAFATAEILWLGYVAFQLAFLLVLEPPPQACRPFDHAFALHFWRGITVGLLIWLAYRFATRHPGNPNVQ